MCSREFDPQHPLNKEGVEREREERRKGKGGKGREGEKINRVELIASWKPGSRERKKQIRYIFS